MRPAERLIETVDLDLTYAHRSVLRAVDFYLDRGEIVTVVGPNGSGKSTLLKALIGVLPPSNGQVWRAPGLRIGYVPQKLNVDATLPITVGRFLRLGNPTQTDDIAQLSAHLGIEHVQGHALSDLSGGQTQRVMLARALLGQPDLLILDEATQGLDQPAAATFYQLIENTRQSLNCGILMVSHDLHVVMGTSDRVVCVNGHICCQGTPEVVRSSPDYHAMFGTSPEGSFALYRHAHTHSHEE